jgi:hypothetical protein
MSDKKHYVTELKQELAESQARIQLAKSMAIDFESFIMTHHKFIIDTTIQTGDVKRWLDNSLHKALTYNFSQAYDPKFVNVLGTVYVEFLGEIITENHVYIYPKLTEHNAAMKANLPKFARSKLIFPEHGTWWIETEENMFRGEKTIRMTILTAYELGLI